MDANTILVILTPFVVFGAGWVARQLISNVSGWIVTAIVVPLTSAVIAMVANVAGLSPNFIIQLVVGCAGVFLAEFYKQIQQAKEFGFTLKKNNGN